MSKVAIGSPLPHPCPLCGGRMLLRGSRFGLFYGCQRFPDCRSTHGAHPNGEPLGIPADAETKRWRIKAHAAFDTLWKNGAMSRNDAYRWMQVALGLGRDEAHIGRFDAYLFQRLIAAVQELAR